MTESAVTESPAAGVPTVATAPAAAGVPAVIRPARARSARRLPVRTLLCLLPVVAVAVWAVRHRAVVADGMDRLLAADPALLLVAVAVTALSWVAAACTRQGALVRRLPAGRLLATQFAAGAANHLLPSGLGAGAVNLRFMTVCGVPLAQASSALALYLVAGAVGRLALTLVLLAAVPGALPLDRLLPDGVGVATAGLVAVGVVVTLVLVVGALRRVVRRFLVTVAHEARAVHRRPARVLALWGGAVLFPALQAAGLVAVALSLGVRVPVAHLALAYLAATAAAALVPTPGGIGSVEAALTIALVGTGVTAASATAVVLGYRLITIWLPLLPGALTLAVLVRCKVL
ncbi:lysylphosphatidylglycerol synthase transmembrane domain-containing protein [Streptomyces pactum]|uniref:lysylphosphatidylglycerol synthase transmembrane domain-containing protein n=1 Tax=Streptomyces pactum TaxID=68249 RepID=UPI0036FADA0C